MTISMPQSQPASLPITRRPVTLGVIVGNRGFFPKHLVTNGRQAILEVLEQNGINALITPENDTSYGAVESLQEAQHVAAFFRQHRDEIDGILVTLPNFGDERAIANTLRMADLRRAGADPRLPGRCDQNDHQRPPRQFLRQDERLQQSTPVRHQVHADGAAHDRSAQ